MIARPRHEEICIKAIISCSSKHKTHTRLTEEKAITDSEIPTTRDFTSRLQTSILIKTRDIFQDVCKWREVRRFAVSSPKALANHVARYIFYHYDPSKVAAIIFVVLFALATLYHTFALVKARTWYCEYPDT